MADLTTDNRPWWRKKTNIAAIATITGTTLLAFPGAPVVFTVGAFVFTTHVLGTFLTGCGAALGFYGVADRVSKTKK